MKQTLKNISIGFLGAALIAFLCALTARAIIKTSEFEDAVRAERCATYGENISKDLAPYCANLGA